MLRYDRIIDYDVFRAVEGQWLVRSALSYQTHYSIAPDVISVDDAKVINEAFMNKCAFEGEWS